jgi:hypothetical protein
MQFQNRFQSSILNPGIGAQRQGEGISVSARDAMNEEDQIRATLAA